MVKKILLLIVSLCSTCVVSAQAMSERDHIRKGYKLYTDSLFEKAEVEFRKALEINPKNTDAMFNLGNALFNQILQSQEKGKEAMEQYVTAAKLETDKSKLALINHNLGVLLYMAQQYAQSVEAYKEALRNDPSDHETRYNLAKAMHMLKQQEQNQDQQQDQQQQQEQQQTIFSFSSTIYPNLIVYALNSDSFLSVVQYVDLHQQLETAFSKQCKLIERA